MNKNIIIVLVGGFIIALFVMMMVRGLVNQQKTVVAEIPTVQILVAAKDLKVGHEIAEGDLKWQKWPQEQAFLGAIIRDGEQSPMDVRTGKLLRSLAAGQPVSMTLFSEKTGGDFLTTQIGAGMRAVGVSVSKHVVADRLVQPGDYVDVIMTYRVRIGTSGNPEAQSLVNRYASETVIKNVRILAIDRVTQTAVDAKETGKKKSKTSTKNATTVTLEVTPNQAERLVLADQMGDLAFAVRAHGDRESLEEQVKVESPKYNTDIGVAKVLTRLTQLNGGGGGQVRIYNGSSVETFQARGTMETNGIEFNVDEAPSQLSNSLSNSLNNGLSTQEGTSALPGLQGIANEE